MATSTPDAPPINPQLGDRIEAPGCPSLVRVAKFCAQPYPRRTRLPVGCGRPYEGWAYELDAPTKALGRQVVDDQGRVLGICPGCVIEWETEYKSWLVEIQAPAARTARPRVADLRAPDETDDRVGF